MILDLFRCKLCVSFWTWLLIIRELGDGGSGVAGCLVLEVFVACLSIKIIFGGAGWPGALGCLRASVGSD